MAGRKQNRQDETADISEIAWKWPTFELPLLPYASKLSGGNCSFTYATRNEGVRQSETHCRARRGMLTEDEYQTRLFFELGGFGGGMIPDAITEANLADRMSQMDRRAEVKLLLRNDTRVRDVVNRVLAGWGLRFSGRVPYPSLDNGVETAQQAQNLSALTKLIKK